MTIIRLVFGVIVFFFLLFVFLQNAEERVNFNFLNYSFTDLPLFWVIFFSFLAGSLFVILLAIYQEIRLRYKILKKNVEINNLRREINELRRMLAEETSFEVQSQRETQKQEIKEKEEE
ncbi:MAG: LapA family protein [Candidatus Hydrothermales bacterium]